MLHINLRSKAFFIVLHLSFAVSYYVNLKKDSESLKKGNFDELSSTSPSEITNYRRCTFSCNLIELPIALPTGEFELLRIYCIMFQNLIFRHYLSVFRLSATAVAKGNEKCDKRSVRLSSQLTNCIRWTITQQILQKKNTKIVSRLWADLLRRKYSYKYCYSGTIISQSVCRSLYNTTTLRGQEYRMFCEKCYYKSNINKWFDKFH